MAARETLRIILQLRDANMLHNPHSMFCTFPIFVAGIEVDDPIYQDWTLQLLNGFGDWGSHTQRARNVVQQVMKRQEEKSCRVSVEGIIYESGMVIFL